MKSNTRSNNSNICYENKKYVEEKEPEQKEKPPVIIMKDLKVREEKKVHFSEDTKNNEGLGLKKSKSNFIK